MYDLIVLSISFGTVTSIAIAIRVFFRRGYGFNEAIIKPQPPIPLTPTGILADYERPRQQFKGKPFLSSVDITALETQRLQTPLPGYDRFKPKIVEVPLWTTLNLVAIPKFITKLGMSPGEGIRIPKDAPKARFSYASSAVTALLTFAATIWWGGFRLNEFLHAGALGEFRISYWFMLAIMIVQLALAYLQGPIKSRGRSVKGEVAVLLSVYNEDTTSFAECLYSLLYQTRRPDIISVTDDGSKEDYQLLRQWFELQAQRANVKVRWEKVPNAGKRHGQMAALRRVPTADYAVTIDSDCILDPHAIEEIMIPFQDPKVQSVAGVIISSNSTVNLLTRIMNVLFIVQQFTDRSSLSFTGNVLVNSGGLAAYPATLLRRCEEAFLNETFGTMKVPYSDDSWLSLWALLNGKTVQQSSAFVFTGMPDNLDFHARQQQRWLKGSFIRSFSRLKYLPLLSAGYIRQFLGWAQLLLVIQITLTLLIIDPLFFHRLPPWQMAVTPLVIGYGLTLRYWNIFRSDLTFLNQLIDYLLTPIMVFWNMTSLRYWRIMTIVTVRQQKKKGGSAWGTRQQVEFKR